MYRHLKWTHIWTAYLVNLTEKEMIKKVEIEHEDNVIDKEFTIELISLRKGPVEEGWRGRGQ